MLVKQRILSKGNNDVGYVRGAGGGPAQIEFAVPNALLQKAREEFLTMTQAFLNHGAAKLEICLKEFMTARGAVDDVGGCTVLRNDRGADSFRCGSWLSSGGFSKIPRV